MQTRLAPAETDLGIRFLHFKRAQKAAAGEPERHMNEAFRLRSSGPVHLPINVSAALAERLGEVKMFAKVSKLSAPIAAAIFLVSAGLATTATAAPQPGKLQVQTPQAELVIKADHRRGHGRHGWDGGHRGRHQFMGPRQIHRSLRHRGFRDINILDRRGPMYVVKARGWRGVPMRLVVDSRNARIVRSQPMWHHGRGHHRWH